MPALPAVKGVCTRRTGTGLSGRSLPSTANHTTMSEPVVSETQVGNAQRMFIGGAPSSQQQGNSPTAVSPEASQRVQAYASGCPVVGGAQPAGAFTSGCPVVGVNPSNQMPQSSNQALPGQTKPLSTYRVQSSIPIAAGDSAPEHQAGESSGVWVYPSEQMFYNAMKRKGWTPSEDDMTAVVAIHNAVNERAWREILRWESAHSSTPPRLLKLRGRPQDYSPKARLLNLLGYKLPFDRHDWVVDRDGQEVRYVIDFYNAAPLPTMPVAMHLDVRPALDSVGAAWDRLRMQFRWVASGRWRGERR